MMSLIKRSSIISTRQTQTFTTYSDNQHGIDIKIVEDEHTMTKDQGGKAHSQPFEWLRMDGNGCEWMGMVTNG
jgi:molecular chaperone DnaK (HSP70)